MDNPNPCYLDPSLPMVRMWKVMAEQGMSLALFGHLFAPEARKLKIPLPVLQYTFGPLIVHSMGGGEDGLEWLTKDVIERWRPRVSVERLEILCGERPDMVSPTEIVLVTYNATMTAPLRHEVTQLYLWAGRRAAHGRDPQSTALDDLLAADSTYPLPSDEAVFAGYLNQEYRSLCQAIHRKVIQHSTISARPAPAQ